MSTRIIEVTNSDDLIDIRDVIARVEELEDLVSELHDSEECEDCQVCPNCEGMEKADDCTDHQAIDCGKADSTTEDWSDEQQELKSLTGLLEDLKGNGGDEDWRGDWYPIILVRDSYFRDFAQQEAEDLDLIKPDTHWPYACIDWEQAASELQIDYTTVEFDGVTYWYR